MKPVASYDVVIVTHNHAKTLPACLKAVAALDSMPAEVVVVDNASADGSAQIAETLVDQLPLQIVRLEENEGFAAGANRGIAVSSSEWVLLLNPDCALESNCAANLLNAVTDHDSASSIGAATGLLMRSLDADLRPGPLVDSAGMVMTPGGRHFDRGAGSDNVPLYAQPAWVFGGTGAATIYRRAALDDVAYPDGQIFAESFFAYREDAELAWRLQWRGWRCLYWPQAQGSHLRGFQPEHGRRGHDVINFHSVKNRFLLRAHCADMGWHFWRFPWWFVRDLLVIGACLTVERSSRPALQEAWRLRHEAKQRRRHVLATARTSSRRMRQWFRTGGWVEEISA